MNRKLLLSSAIALALGGAGSAQAWVDLAPNANNAPNWATYAQEMRLTTPGTPGYRVLLSSIQPGGALGGLAQPMSINGSLSARVPLGVGVDTGEVRYVRFDLGNNIQFGQNLDAGFGGATTTNFRVGACPGPVNRFERQIMGGGNQGDDFVVIRITANCFTAQNWTVAFDPRTLWVGQANDHTTPTIRYRHYSNITSAINADDALLVDSGDQGYFLWGQGYALGCTNQQMHQIDVLRRDQWYMGNTPSDQGPRTFGNVTADVAPNILNEDGDPVIPGDYFSGTSSAVITDTNLTAFDAIAIGGVNPDNTTFSTATWGSPFGTLLDSVPWTNAPFELTPEMGTDMSPASYSFRLNQDLNAFVDNYIIPEPTSFPCGSLQFSGSTDRADFSLGAANDGNFERQIFRVTNPSDTGGSVKVAVYTDGGVETVFDLGDIEGQDTIVGAFASTNMFSLGQLLTAAEDAGLNLDVETSKRLRVEVRAAFGGNARDANFRPGATAPGGPGDQTTVPTGFELEGRRADGVVLQTFVATDFVPIRF